MKGESFFFWGWSLDINPCDAFILGALHES